MKQIAFSIALVFLFACKKEQTDKPTVTPKNYSLSGEIIVDGNSYEFSCNYLEVTDTLLKLSVEHYIDGLFSLGISGYSLPINSSTELQNDSRMALSYGDDDLLYSVFETKKANSDFMVQTLRLQDSTYQITGNGFVHCLIGPSCYLYSQQKDSVFIDLDITVGKE